MLRLYPIRHSIKAFLIADETYLNGVSKEELETAITLLKAAYQDNNWPIIPTMLNFASALFNKSYAHFVNNNLEQSTLKTDQYYLSQIKQTPQNETFISWSKKFQTQRLVSYDQSGNLYTGGGLPSVVDMVSFDYYLSTL